MEAVAPVGAAEEGAIVIQFCLARLRGNRFPRVNGMLVADPLDDPARVDTAVVVERHAILLVRIEALQDIHVVRHGDVAARVFGNMVIPRGPGTPPFRHQRSIAMQYRLVLVVAHRAEHLAFLRCRILENCERLVAVTGEEHKIEAFGLAAAGTDFDLRTDAAY